MSLGIPVNVLVNALNISLGIKTPKHVGVLPNRGTVTLGTGTVGTRFIETNYPNEEGLIAGTTKQTGKPNL